MKALHKTLAVSTIFFYCCGDSPFNPEQKDKAILDSFERVDSSLLSSKGLLDNTNKEILKAINRNNDAYIADTSLNKKREIVTSLISTIKERLQREMERTGNEEDTAFVNKIFFTEQQGEKLHQAIKDYEHLLHALKNPIADSILSSSLSVPNELMWAKIYFRDAPIIAAITMLRKIELDIQRSYLSLLKST